MSDHMHHGAHDPRSLRDGRADRSAIGHRMPRRDDMRAAGAQRGEDWSWAMDGNPDAQPDHGERNG